MSKTGLVLKTHKNTATIVTATGEFVKVTISKNPPKIGETYTGTIRKEKRILKPFAAAAAIALFLLSSAGVYAYSVPATTVEVSINPSIELKLNYFNKIIKSTPLNEDGNTLLKNIDVKNKNIDEALTLLVSQAKKDNFINDAYVEEGKIISVKILSKNKNLNISNFENYIDNNKLNTNIDNNGKEVKKEFPKEKTPINNEANKKDKTSTPPGDSKEKENKNSNTNNNSQKDKEKNTENKSGSNENNGNRESSKNNNNSNNKNNNKANHNNDIKNDNSNNQNNTGKGQVQNMKKK